MPPSPALEKVARVKPAPPFGRGPERIAPAGRSRTDVSWRRAYPPAGIENRPAGTPASTSCSRRKNANRCKNSGGFALLPVKAPFPQPNPGGRAPPQTLPCFDPVMKPRPSSTILARAFQALAAAPAAVLRPRRRSRLSAEFDSLWMGAGIGADARPTGMACFGGPDDTGLEAGGLAEAARFAFSGLDGSSDDSDGGKPRGTTASWLQ